MADREQQLLRLGAPKSFPRKKRKPSFPPPPKRNFRRHARGLSNGADAVRKHLEEAERRFPALATDVPYVRVQTADGVVLTDDELKSLNLIVVHRREDAVLAAYATERELRRLDSQLSSYAKQTKKLAVLSKIESIQPWAREDRISPRVADAELDRDSDYVVDLLLLPIEGHSANP
jgi:hypothetical protein